MKRITKIELFGLIMLVSSMVNAQFIDSYGLRIGGGLSNQYWEYKNDIISYLSKWKNYKLRLAIYINAEKKK